MEIERKFLAADSFPFSLSDCPSTQIRQAYLHLSPTIRIRQTDTDSILTVKGKGQIAREEFELPLTEEQFLSLAQKAETPFLEKRRYFYPLPEGLTAEIDVYSGPLAGLVTIEVEFSSLQQAEAFLPPLWFGQDVSNDKRYKNTALCLHGIPK